MKRIILLLSLMIFISSCKDKKDTYEDPELVAEAGLQEHPGKALMEKHCYACHSPESGTRLAPPMSMVQMHYLQGDITKEDFVADIVNFVKEPTEEKAIMYGAIRNFGLMPYQDFPDSVIRQVADYLYETELPQMRGHGGGMQGRGMGMSQNAQENTVAKTGMEIAQATQQQLGKNLMKALEEGGPIHALDFCNVQAIPLTSQMEKEHNAVIKRVSDKNRNPDNAAKKEEKYYITHFKQSVQNGREPVPVVIPKDGKNKFYYPIVTNKMCLQCHGKPEEMKPEVLQKIKELYPEDKALGYSENEVRGIWSIELD
ncbi:MAG: c-type heme family protein [Bacteroidota bacterium]